MARRDLEEQTVPFIELQSLDGQRGTVSVSHGSKAPHSTSFHIRCRKCIWVSVAVLGAAFVGVIVAAIVLFVQGMRRFFDFRWFNNISVVLRSVPCPIAYHC